MACCMSAQGRFTVDKDMSTEKLIQSYNKQMANVNDKLKTIEEVMCNWAQPEVTDIGEGVWGTLWKAAMVGVALINTVAQVQIAKKQHQIAKDYANLAKDKWGRFRDGYAPHEQSILNEVLNTPEPEPDYAGARSRGESYVNEAFLSAEAQAVALAEKYSLCVDSSLLAVLDLMESTTRDDGINFNYRDEEQFALIMSDLRWNRRSSILNLGRDIHQTAAKYADSANQMLANLGNTVSSGAAGAMQMLGYLSERRNTTYPALFSMSSMLTGQASLLGDSIVSGPNGFS